MGQQVASTQEISHKLEYGLTILFLIVSYAIIMTEQTARLFWPYMFVTLALAIGVYFAHNYHRTSSLREYLFSPKVWLHPSAINDYKLFIFNYFIYFKLIALLVVAEPLFLYGWIENSLEYLGFQPFTEKPGFIAALILTGSIVLVNDLTYYIQHRLKHTIPFLWELHKVHHSAEVMTPITFIRGHPVDLLFQNYLVLLGITWCSSIFMYFYPGEYSEITVFGINALVFASYIIGENLHHSNIQLSYGRKVGHILISPIQHQIHHSNNPKHFDKNFGATLAIWDWMFGSLYLPEKNEKITFGLPPEDSKNYDTTLKILWHPMKEMFLILIGKRRTKSKKKKSTAYKV